MERQGWKITAIIFICLFISLILFIWWGITLLDYEEEQTNICYYDICSDYSDAWWEEDVCYCYDYDMLGNLEIVETEYMKK